MHRFLGPFVLCLAAGLFVGCGANTETEVMEGPSQEEMEEIEEYEMQQEEDMNNPEFR